MSTKYCPYITCANQVEEATLHGYCEEHDHKCLECYTPGAEKRFIGKDHKSAGVTYLCESCANKDKAPQQEEKEAVEKKCVCCREICNVDPKNNTGNFYCYACIPDEEEEKNNKKKKRSAPLEKETSNKLLKVDEEGEFSSDVLPSDSLDRLTRMRTIFLEDIKKKNRNTSKDLALAMSYAATIVEEFLASRKI